MNKTNPIFTVVVTLKDGNTMRLCVTTFEQLSYNLQYQDKSLIREMVITPTIFSNAKSSDIRQGRCKD